MVYDNYRILIGYRYGIDSRKNSIIIRAKAFLIDLLFIPS